jgi:PST family polysaccharide transporter
MRGPDTVSTLNAANAASRVPGLSAVSNLGRSAARGALAMVFGQIGRLTVQLAGVLVLARVLSPRDYGAFAMVTAVVSLGELLQDFGLSSAAIQAPTVTRDQQTNLFWINTGIGLSLGVLVFACAPALAAFYNEPILTPITRALAPTFLINGLASQFRAHLTRNFQMTALSVAVVCAQTAGISAGLIGALNGLGPWALVAQQLTFTFVNLVVMIKATQFWPGLPRRNADIGAFLRFGGNLMATNLVGHISRSVNTVLIGNRFGAELAGLYDRAFMLLMLPLNQINVPANTVALPTLSKLQHDSPRFERFLLHGQTVLLHALLGAFAYAAAAGDVLIEIVMGEQWLPAAPLFRILTVAGAFQAASYATYWAFTAKGLTHQTLKFSLVTRSGLVLLLLAGLRWGVTGVTIAYSVGLACMWPIGLIWLARCSDAPALAMAKNGVRCLIAYSACAAAAYAAVCLAPSAAPFTKAVVSLTGMLSGMLVLFLAWPAYRADLYNIANTRTLLKREQRRSSPTPIDHKGTP